MSMMEEEEKAIQAQLKEPPGDMPPPIELDILHEVCEIARTLHNEWHHLSPSTRLEMIDRLIIGAEELKRWACLNGEKKENRELTLSKPS